jgi:hypothetical protein
MCYASNEDVTLFSLFISKFTNSLSFKVITLMHLEESRSPMSIYDMGSVICNLDLSTIQKSIAYSDF